MPQIEIKDGLGNPIKVHEFNGKYFPLFPNIDENLRHLPDMPCRDDDITVLTYPRAGTHWVWEIVNMLYTGDGQISQRHKEDTMMECASIESMTALPSVRLLNTHLTPEFYPKGLLKGKNKIVFVQRNPKDIYVSMYNFIRNAKMFGYEGEWKCFFDQIVDGKVVYGSWFDYTKQWEDFLTKHPDIPVLRLYYEDMKLDLLMEIEKIAKFLDLPCSPSYREKVAENCGFAAMKKGKQLPQEIKDGKFKTSGNPMFRKGIIGDWKRHFTVAQNERFDEEYKKQMKGFTFRFEEYM